MTRNDELINITNRLNYLRLERNRITNVETDCINKRKLIAREESDLYRQIRQHVFIPETPEPVLSEDVVHPINIKLEEDQYTAAEAAVPVSDTEVAVKGEPSYEEEEASRIEEHQLELGVFQGSKRVPIGTRVYINNNISHFKEGATQSALHRLGSVTEHSKTTGRIYIDTDSGHSVWRKKKNLSLVLAE